MAGSVCRAAASRPFLALPCPAVCQIGPVPNHADDPGLPRSLPVVASDHVDYDYNGNVTLTGVVAEVIAHWTLLQRENDVVLGDRRDRFKRHWVSALDAWHRRYEDTCESLQAVSIARSANVEINSSMFCSSTAVFCSHSSRSACLAPRNQPMRCLVCVETWRCRLLKRSARGA